MYTFTVIKGTGWKAVIVFWKRPSRKGSIFWKSRNLAINA